ncbi:hypothetical protein FLJC2902T_20580 [Flavobacterium limnosediminis JC2902]|uniref:Uncharacterized protein n=1 Tax=Flavobacterium limnosediminis JC2902 TaxID=1341181 RepID=V6SKX8_9FLAO|nr:hypothetical protein [Flavobacterium limnosediminis]ESU27353.1 hypothetical protein FLJC2902T_20580 [Flavobacterium limnosediminis JC2902]
MASTSEVGHVKNVANYNALCQLIEEMGALYNPSNPSIQLLNLQPIRASLTAAIQNLDSTKPIYKNAVSRRETAIASLGKTTSSVMNFFKSLNVSEADKENVESIAKKIRGDKKGKTINPEITEGATISTSQMSYDSRIANLNILVSLVSSHPEYAPNESRIQTTTLNQYHLDLSTLSQDVNVAGNSLITARNQRNIILYNGDVNVIQLAKDIKSYLKSLGESAVPYYKAAVRLKFRDNN